MSQSLRNTPEISRRQFLQAGAMTMAASGVSVTSLAAWSADLPFSHPLAEFGYTDVSIASAAHESQLMNTHSVLMALSEDSLLKPFRQMSGMLAPGEDLGGWYTYDPDYDYRKSFDSGFAPGCTFGQWVSALARTYAITGEEEARQKVLRLNRLYAETITADFYIRIRFPTYIYDKLLLGIMDSNTYAKDPQALASWSTQRIQRCRTFRAMRSSTIARGEAIRIPVTRRGPGTSRTPCRRTCLWVINAAWAGGIMSLACSISTTKPGSIRCRATRTC
jgi:hypothetical protein